MCHDGSCRQPRASLSIVIARDLSVCWAAWPDSPDRAPTVSLHMPELSLRDTALSEGIHCTHEKQAKRTQPAQQGKIRPSACISSNYDHTYDQLLQHIYRITARSRVQVLATFSGKNTDCNNHLAGLKSPSAFRVVSGKHRNLLCSVKFVFFFFFLYLHVNTDLLLPCVFLAYIWEMYSSLPIHHKLHHHSGHFAIQPLSTPGLGLQRKYNFQLQGTRIFTGLASM